MKKLKRVETMEEVEHKKRIAIEVVTNFNLKPITVKEREYYHNNCNPACTKGDICYIWSSSYACPCNSDCIVKVCCTQVCDKWIELDLGLRALRKFDVLDCMGLLKENWRTLVE